MSLTEVSLDDYKKVIEAMVNVSFEQSVPWISSKLVSGVKYRYFVDGTESPTMALAGRHRSYFGRKFINIQGGPSFSHSYKFSSITSDLDKLADGYDVIYFESSREYCPKIEVELRRAGFKRPFFFKVCPMSIVVDCDTSKFSRNWKREIKKSKGLLFELVEKPAPADCRRFSKIFEEMKENKGLSYSPSIRELQELLSHSDMKLFVASEGGKWIAARIVWINQTYSHDVFAANSMRAREIGASHYLLSNMFEWFNKNNIKKFDFGRIGPSQHSSDSVYMFKRGAGGDPIGYLGGWIRSKSLFFDMAILGFNLIKKRTRW